MRINPTKIKIAEIGRWMKIRRFPLEYRRDWRNLSSNIEPRIKAKIKGAGS